MVTLKLITALASAIKLFLIHQAYYKVEVAVPIRLLAVSAFLAALYLLLTYLSNSSLQRPTITVWTLRQYLFTRCLLV